VKCIRRKKITFLTRKFIIIICIYNDRFQLLFNKQCENVLCSNRLNSIRQSGRRIKNIHRETYMTSFDYLEFNHVALNSHNKHRETRPFDDMRWYFSWIEYDHKIIHHHLLERAMRQYGRIQTILRHPSTVPQPNIS